MFTLDRINSFVGTAGFLGDPEKAAEAICVIYYGCLSSPLLGRMPITMSLRVRLTLPYVSQLSLYVGWLQLQ